MASATRIDGRHRLGMAAGLAVPLVTSTALGAGEGSQAPTGAAIANAIFAATGRRVTEIPFTPGRVLAALQT